MANRAYGSVSYDMNGVFRWGESKLMRCSSNLLAVTQATVVAPNGLFPLEVIQALVAKAQELGCACEERGLTAHVQATTTLHGVIVVAEPGSDVGQLYAAWQNAVLGKYSEEGVSPYGVTKRPLVRRPNGEYCTPPSDTCESGSEENRAIAFRTERYLTLRDELRKVAGLKPVPDWDDYLPEHGQLASLEGVDELTLSQGRAFSYAIIWAKLVQQRLDAGERFEDFAEKVFEESQLVYLGQSAVWDGLLYLRRLGWKHAGKLDDWYSEWYNKRHPVNALPAQAR